MSQDYQKILKDPRWQRKRLEIYQRDKFTCQLCQDIRTTLCVHHEAYNGNPWDVPNDCLKTLCAHCHDIVHKLDKFEIIQVEKRISINKKCWEVVAYTLTGIIFMYMFFVKDNDDIGEIIIVFTDLKIAA